MSLPGQQQLTISSKMASEQALKVYTAVYCSTLPTPKATGYQESCANPCSLDHPCRSCLRIMIILQHDFFILVKLGKRKKRQHVLGLSNLAWSGLLDRKFLPIPKKNAAVRREEEDCSWKKKHQSLGRFLDISF